MPNKNVLVVDDELASLDWLFAYFTAKNIDYDVAINAEKARELIQNTYDLYIIDLNIPYTFIKPGKPEIYHSYAGLNIAQEIRSKGVPGSKVVIYSVHITPELDVEITTKLSCKYVIKGRIAELKSLFQNFLK